MNIPTKAPTHHLRQLLPGSGVGGQWWIEYTCNIWILAMSVRVLDLMYITSNYIKLCPNSHYFSRLLIFIYMFILDTHYALYIQYLCV